jgi:hypothetical protein
MKCWKCSASLEDPDWGKVLFREECSKCGAALHCCKNCQYYKPGVPNDCAVPGTDFIADREAINFCEEFKLRSQKKEQFIDPATVEKRLFGQGSSQEQNKSSSQKGFDSLFKE